MTELILHNLPWAIIFIFMILPLILYVGNIKYQNISSLTGNNIQYQKIPVFGMVLLTIVSLAPLFGCLFIILSGNYGLKEQSGSFIIIGMIIRPWLEWLQAKF